MMEKISVIIPVYNAENTIQRCIESVLMQTVQDFCIYVVDDCSDDKSLSILKKISGSDNRIKVFHLKENQGPSAARNVALDVCQGEWISFIDSDDYIDENFFAEMLAYEKQSDIIIGSFKQVDKNGKIIRQYNASSYYVAKSSEDALDIAYGKKDDLDFVYNLCCNKLYRKKLFRNIRFPVNKLQEDAFIMPYLIYNINKSINCAEKAIYYYVDNGNSVSHQGQCGIKDLQRRCDLVYMYECHIKLYEKYNNKLYLRSRANLLNNIIAIYRLHYGVYMKSNKDLFLEEFFIFKKHYWYAVKESNPYLSWRLLLSWLLFIFSPKLYLKLL